VRWRRNSLRRNRPRARRPRTWLVAALVAAVILPDAAGAGGPAGFVFRGSSSRGVAVGSGVAVGAFGALALGFGAAGVGYRESGWRDDPAFLIVDVTPPDAHVYLDGRRLGTAGELVARALAVALGVHTVHVQAPGRRARAVQFLADGTFPIHIRAALAAQ
jgi:hypothetical protein